MDNTRSHLHDAAMHWRDECDRLEAIPPVFVIASDDYERVVDDKGAFMRVGLCMPRTFASYPEALEVSAMMNADLINARSEFLTLPCSLRTIAAREYRRMAAAVEAAAQSSSSLLW